MLFLIPVGILLAAIVVSAVIPAHGAYSARGDNIAIGTFIGVVLSGLSILALLGSASLVVVRDKQDIVAIDDGAYLVIDQDNVATFQTPGFNYVKSGKVERVTYDGDPYVETLAYCATMLPNWNMCDPSRDSYRVYLDPETVKVAG